MSKSTRSEKVKSPEYRTFIGKKLRKRRISYGYTLSDISEMTTIPINTIIGMEKGDVVNVDYYVEYAKTVKYQLATLRNAGIKLIPKKELSKESSKRIKLTMLIRKYILEKDFLQTNRTSKQILEELERIKVVPKETVTTTDIAGVMRNMISDDIIKKGRKIGNRDSYIVRNE